MSSLSASERVPESQSRNARVVCFPPVLPSRLDAALELKARNAGQDWYQSGPSSLPAPMRKHIGAST
jgi:hypothetical protein